MIVTTQTISADEFTLVVDVRNTRDKRDMNGRTLPPGLYTVRVETGAERTVTRLVLVK